MNTPHLSHLLPLLLSCTGFSLLALSMARHQEDVWRRLLAPRPTLIMRCSGWALLMLALLLSVQSLGLGMGLVSWFGQLSMAAGLVFVGLLIHQRLKSRR
ncbi:MAG: DUF3325 domain-containing protein [Lautropia sp.]|nr:DUF3325 domain-containing protein [Lautropia sp.]